MNKSVRLILALWAALFAFAFVAQPSSAVAATVAAPTGTCSAGFTIATTSPGTVSMYGPLMVVRDSGVGGAFTSGFLAGYTFTGEQDYTINTSTNKAYLIGTFTATGPGGTITLPYVVKADMVTGAGSGYFASTSGTGEFANYLWAGELTAQIVNPNPTTFVVNATGNCEYTS
ncbi:hypothetical protein F8S13_11480 [Chloroflexia bacterium SDU3-3]|nr:hypothetical protein F8S13_11480 [Chloroflexia bacterium SDU3-3]